MPSPFLAPFGDRVNVRVTAKPFVAKLSDTASRPTAYLVSLLFYVLGFIVVASAQNVNALAAGMFNQALYHVARLC